MLVLSGALWFFLQAQQSVDLIQGELSKVMDNADGLIENSSPTSQTVRIYITAGMFGPFAGFTRTQAHRGANRLFLSDRRRSIKRRE